MPYQTRVEGNNIVVTAGAAAPRSMAHRRQSIRDRDRANVAAAAGLKAIRKIDFRRGADGAGRVVVRAQRSAHAGQPAASTAARSSWISPRTELLERTRCAATTSWISPRRSTAFDVHARRQWHAARHRGDGDYEQLAYQTDDEYVGRDPAEDAAGGRRRKRRTEYTGERLTLNFQDIETRAVLQLLAETSGQNIVVSDSVQRQRHAALAERALGPGAGHRAAHQGPRQAPAGQRDHRRPLRGARGSREGRSWPRARRCQELAPLRTEYLQVNYAKASDLAELIKSQGKSSLLSDARQCRDRRAHQHAAAAGHGGALADIRRLVATLDIPVEQVLIEARIVIVNDDFSRDLGVRFGTDARSSQRRQRRPERDVGTGGLDRSPVIGSAYRQPARPRWHRPDRHVIQTPTVDDRYMVNLPVANPAGRIALTLLDSDYIVDLEMSAAQAEGRGEVVSAPRVITANQQGSDHRAGRRDPVPGGGLERSHDHRSSRKPCCP